MPSDAPENPPARRRGARRPETPPAGDHRVPEPGPAATPHELRVLRALRRIMRATDLHSRKLEAEVGLTGPQLICLHTVVASEGLSVSEVSQQIHVSNSTVVGILDRLQRRGLVQRERSDCDRRRVQVSATPAGRELIARSPSALQDRLAAGLAALPEPEQAAIARALEQVVDLMEARHLEAAPILTADPLEPGS